MKKRMLLLFGISISLLLVFSFLVYSQVKPVESKYVTQDVFINILVKTLGLEDQLPAGDPQKVAATASDKAALLASFNIAPVGGWQPTKMLSKGDAAYVICQILGINVNPTGTETKILAENNISNQSGKYIKVSVSEIPPNTNNISNNNVQFNQKAINLLALAIKALVDRGIMTPGEADSPFSLEDLRAIINVAAGTPGVYKIDKLYKALDKLESEGWTSSTLPWQEDISPTR